MIATLGIALTLSACEYTEIDGVGTRTGDDVNPPQTDLVAFEGCAPQRDGRWGVDATITNQTDVVSSYELTVAFYEGETRLEERSTWVRDLKPAETASVDRAWWIGQAANQATHCEVLTINRFG